jgi:hypothetical protein
MLVFEPSEATVSPPASADRALAQNTDSQQSWFSRLTRVLAKNFSKQPQQSSVQQSSISAYSSAYSLRTSRKYGRGQLNRHSEAR